MLQWLIDLLGLSNIVSSLKTWQDARHLLIDLEANKLIGNFDRCHDGFRVLYVGGLQVGRVGMMWGWMQLKTVKMIALQQKGCLLGAGCAGSAGCYLAWWMSNVAVCVCQNECPSKSQGIFLYQTDPSFERSVRFWRLTGPIAWSLFLESGPMVKFILMLCVTYVSFWLPKVSCLWLTMTITISQNPWRGCALLSGKMAWSRWLWPWCALPAAPCALCTGSPQGCRGTFVSCGLKCVFGPCRFILLIALRFIGYK